MSGKREHEHTLFKAFVELEPEFAGEALADWHQPKQENAFPDIVGTTVSGRRVGVELGEWINQDEMQAAKAKEQREEEFLAAVGDQGTNTTQHIQFVWLHPKAKARIAPVDASEFREQLFGFIHDCDRRWPGERFWRVGHRAAGDELAPYPKLARYLDAITLWPSEGEGQFTTNWITFPMPCGSFDRETMWAPLRKLVADKIGHYGSTNIGFEVLSLVIVYNQALIYNSPAETPLFSFEDAVAELREMIHDPSPFHRVFLHIALVPGRVLKVL